MKVVRPSAYSLIHTSVPDNVEPIWAAGTTYDLGDLVQVTDITVHRVYRSARGGNIGRYPPDWTEPQQETATSTTSHESSVGAKTFTVQSGKGFSAGMVVRIVKTTTPRTVNMTAEVIAYAGTSLQVSVYAQTGEGIHGNWTITTEDEIGFWDEIGATNQYACLDEYVNTQTVALDEIHMKLQVDRIDHVALFALAGKEVAMTLWDGEEATVLWEATVSLAYGTIGVQSASWWEYFYGEFALQTTCAVAIPFASSSAVLELRVVAAAGTHAAVGAMALGRSQDIGIATYGMSAGMLDYSTRETDEYGRTKLEPGPWAKRCGVDLRVENKKIDSVYQALSSLRAVPTAWLGVPGVDGFESFNVFGTFREFDITVAGNRQSWCRLEIEGLI